MLLSELSDSEYPSIYHFKKSGFGVKILLEDVIIAQKWENKFENL